MTGLRLLRVRLAMHMKLQMNDIYITIDLALNNDFQNKINMYIWIYIFQPYYTLKWIINVYFSKPLIVQKLWSISSHLLYGDIVSYMVTNMTTFHYRIPKHVKMHHLRSYIGWLLEFYIGD